MRLKMVNGKTKLLCLLGSPVEHSFSPMMHNASFQKMNIDAKYMAFDVHPNQLKHAIEGLRALRFVGANITFPHKVTVLDYVDVLDPKAALIGACNTLLYKNDTLYGYNTDVSGFIESFQSFKYELKNKKIAILGTGGAAKAILVGFLCEDVEYVHLFSRTVNKAEALSSSLKDYDNIVAKTYEELDENEPYDVIVNATPLGMHPFEGKVVINPSHIGYIDTIFYDLIYNPQETEFLRLAKQSGRRTINGLEMLINQGIDALNLWFDFDCSDWSRTDVLKVLKANNII